MMTKLPRTEAQKTVVQTTTDQKYNYFSDPLFNGGCGGLVPSALNSRSRFEPWLRTLFCVLGQDTVINSHSASLTQVYK